MSTRRDRGLVYTRLVAAACREYRVPIPDPEVRFHPTRRWRFDFAWPARKVALEVEGGVWTRGRHTRGAGFQRDMEKYNAATELGWRVFRVSPAQLHGSDIYQQIARVLHGSRGTTGTK